MLLIISTIVAIAAVIILLIIEAPIWSVFLGFFGGYIITFVIFMISAGIVALTLGKKERVLLPKPVFTKFIMAAVDFIVSFFRLKIIYEGQELLEGLEGYEIVSNHQSNFDPIITLKKLPRKDTSFVMKMELMRIAIVGRFLYGGGFYPLDRNNNREGLKTILQSAKAIEAGRPIGIYVEGTRSKGPNIGPFHDGAFKMAYRANCPIVVAVVDNTYRVSKRFPWRSTTVLFKICRVLNYEEFKDLSTKDLDILIKDIMDKALNESREKHKKLNE